VSGGGERGNVRATFPLTLSLSKGERSHHAPQPLTLSPKATRLSYRATRLGESLPVLGSVEGSKGEPRTPLDRDLP